MAHYKLCNMTVSGQNNPRSFVVYQVKATKASNSLLLFNGLCLLLYNVFRKLLCCLRFQPENKCSQGFPKQKLKFGSLCRCLGLFEKIEVNYHIFGSLRNPWLRWVPKCSHDTFWDNILHLSCLLCKLHSWWNFPSQLGCVKAKTRVYTLKRKTLQ